MDPANLCCPSDISYLRMTDYRPNKVHYQHIYDNNAYRIAAQSPQGWRYLMTRRNASIRDAMSCCCERNIPGPGNIMAPGSLLFNR